MQPIFHSIKLTFIVECCTQTEKTFFFINAHSTWVCEVKELLELKKIKKGFWFRWHKSSNCLIWIYSECITRLILSKAIKSNIVFENEIIDPA